MRRGRTPMTAVTAVLVLALAACGGGGGPAGAAAADADGKVGVILPDTVSSTRWETADRPLLEKAFKDAGVAHDIQNADGDARRMAAIAEKMIAGGVTVLAIVNLDPASGALIERQAAQQGVQTIDYDRLTLGGSAEYYVSFDNVRVGELQAKGLARCLGNRKADIAFLNGSPDDNNATLFARGAHRVLDPMRSYDQVAEQAVPKWDTRRAATIFEQMYTQVDGRIQGVLAANDALADAVISVLGRDDRAGKVPVTGQDATVEGLQNILAGDQCMTVYKPIAQEAQALADLAIALIDGRDGDTKGVTARDPKGHRRVPAILLRPSPIFRDDVRTVIDAGYQSAADVCTAEFAAACTELGIEIGGS